MMALSIRQPWASLICAGIPIFENLDIGNSLPKVVFKDVENRTWPTHYRGRIYVHAGKTVDNEAMYRLIYNGIDLITVLMQYSSIISRGAIIGEVDIINCVTESRSIWFTGPYGFVLANPVSYDKPITCRGKLCFFVPDI